MVTQTASGAPSRPEQTNTHKAEVTVGPAQPTFNLDLPSSVTNPNVKGAASGMAVPGFGMLGMAVGTTLAISVAMGGVLGPVTGTGALVGFRGRWQVGEVSWLAP